MKETHNISERDYLDSYSINNYDRPSIATDMVVFTIKSEDAKIIENYLKKNWPFY